jgi:hypothetical protein
MMATSSPTANACGSTSTSVTMWPAPANRRCRSSKSTTSGLSACT